MRRDDFEMPRTRARIAGDIDDEMRAHIEERVSELVARGIAPDEARRMAEREFGDIDAARAELLQVGVRNARVEYFGDLVADLGTDMRRTFAGLMRRPMFTLVAVATLGLGIGANAVMYGLLDRLILSPPPHVADGEQVVRLGFDVRNRGGRITWVRGAYPAYETIATQRDVFEDVAAYADRPLTLAIDGQAIELNAAAVTSNYFSLLGVRAAVGRLLAKDDDLSVVISHKTWRQHFGGASVVGRPVRLGGARFTIVGVTPPGFGGDGLRQGDGVRVFDAWIRLGDATPSVGARWRASQVFMLGRLRSNVTAARASAQLSQVYRNWLATTPTPDSTARVEVAGLIVGRNPQTGALTASARVAVWLQVVSLLVLVIAIANVVNLLLLRAIDRQGEIAVHLALGMSRVRLLRHVTLENVVLAAAGGLLAVVIAGWAGPTLWDVVIPGGMDGRALAGTLAAVAAAIAALSAVIMTAVPVMLQSVTVASDVLRGGSRTMSRRGSRLGDALIVLQVTLTVVLLVGAGLFMRSMQRLESIDLGFETKNVIGARITVDGASDAAARSAMFARVRTALETLPGVESVSMGLSSPFRPSMNMRFSLPGKDALPGVGENGLGFPRYFAVTPEYLGTMGIPLLRGRGFTSADGAGSARVVIIDATMARTFWPGEDAVGRCVHLVADTMPCTTVVGVVADTRRMLVETTHTLWFYVPIEQNPYAVDDRYFFVRSSRVTPELANTVRATIASSAPSVPFIESFPMERLLDTYSRQWRLGTSAFMSFGVLATVIATMGLFGIISFGVARRERELGIRRALGESWKRVIGRVVIDAAGRSALGVVVGGVLSYVMGRQLGALLYQPNDLDSVVFIGAAAIVFAATFIASALPAARAARVDPMRALRAE